MESRAVSDEVDGSCWCAGDQWCEWVERERGVWRGQQGSDSEGRSEVACAVWEECEFTASVPSACVDAFARLLLHEGRVAKWWERL